MNFWNKNYSLLRYSKILSPTISNIDSITSIPPSPPNPKPILSRIWKYGIADDTNNERNVLMENIDWTNNGVKKNKSPTIYFELDFKNILI
jgi:hypothetical protein